MPTAAHIAPEKKQTASRQTAPQNNEADQSFQFKDARASTRKLTSLSDLADKQSPAAGEPIAQRVINLNLAGEVTFGAKFKRLFGDGSMFTRLKEKVDTFNEQTTDEAQEPLKADIITLCNQWLGEHRTSKDPNDQIKEASITRILNTLTASKKTEEVVEKAPEATTTPETPASTTPATTPAPTAAPTATDTATATETPVTEPDEDKARLAHAKKQEDKVNKLRDEDGNLADGFVGKMKTKMVSIVKEVQDNEGSIQQKNNLIHGDAAVNTFFADEIAKAKEPEDFIKTNVHADQVFNRGFKAKVMPNKQLQGGPIQSYKTSSLASAKSAKRDVEETAGDKVIVEMYYNELEKMSTQPETDASKKKAESIFKFAKSRVFDVRQRKENLNKEVTKLDEEGRINSLIRRSSVAVGYAVGSALFKIITVGLGSFKPNLDKRGFNSSEDFSLDFDTETATNEKFDTGSFELQSPIGQMRQHYGELTSKMAARDGKGVGPFFSTLSLGLEIFKRFLGIIKGVLSSLAIWSGIIAAIPGAQVMATVAAFCGTIAYYIGLAMSSITTLRIMFDSIAQMANTNPALFSELAGETTKSAATLGIEGASYGLSVGYAEARDAVQDRDVFDKDALVDPSRMVGNLEELASGKDAPSALSDAWFQDKTTLAAGVVSDSIVTGGGAAGLAAGKASVDNAEMKYGGAVNPNRKIGKDTSKSAEATTEESALIMQSYKTTRTKAKKMGIGFVPVVRKFATEPVPQTTIQSEEVSAKDKETAGKIPEIGGMIGDSAGTVVEALEDMQNK